RQPPCERLRHPVARARRARRAAADAGHRVEAAARVVVTTGGRFAAVDHAGIAEIAVGVRSRHADVGITAAVVVLGAGVAVVAWRRERPGHAAARRIAGARQALAAAGEGVGGRAHVARPAASVAERARVAVVADAAGRLRDASQPMIAGASQTLALARGGPSRHADVRRPDAVVPYGAGIAVVAGGPRRRRHAADRGITRETWPVARDRGRDARLVAG